MPPLDVMKNIQLISEGVAYDKLGLVHRVRIPEDEPPAQGFPTLVMVHGHKGNEDVTWVFARNAGSQWLIATPRAPLPSPDGDGYTWNSFSAEGKTETASLDRSLAQLTRFITNLPSVYPADLSRLVLLGFSQGAGMCYAYTATQPQPPLIGMAALGGYIPGPVKLPPLNHLPIFMFHGSKDETIPISLAHKNRDQLIAAGADLTYQEDEVGHKVSAEGMRRLTVWFAERLAQGESPQ